MKEIAMLVVALFFVAVILLLPPVDRESRPGILKDGSVICSSGYEPAQTRSHYIFCRKVETAKRKNGRSRRLSPGTPRAHTLAAL